MPTVGHIEPLAAVIRIPGAYGEPYTWCATLRYLSPTEVEVVGALVAPAPSQWRAIEATCRDAGIRQIRFQRRGQRTWHVFHVAGTPDTDRSDHMDRFEFTTTSGYELKGPNEFGVKASHTLTVSGLEKEEAQRLEDLVGQSAAVMDKGLDAMIGEKRGR